MTGLLVEINRWIYNANYPAYLMLVSFMPAGTRPNIVIFASNKITVPEMAKCSVGMKIGSLIFLPLILYFIIIVVLGMDLALPVWAK
jgi:sodium-dependent dicarboxylate transporter 2/3/5